MKLNTNIHGSKSLSYKWSLNIIICWSSSYSQIHAEVWLFGPEILAALEIYFVRLCLCVNGQPIYYTGLWLKAICLMVELLLNPCFQNHLNMLSTTCKLLENTLLYFHFVFISKQITKYATKGENQNPCRCLHFSSFTDTLKPNYLVLKL